MCFSFFFFFSAECSSPLMCGLEESTSSRSLWSSTMICPLTERTTFTGSVDPVGSVGRVWPSTFVSCFFLLVLFSLKLMVVYLVCVGGGCSNSSRYRFVPFYFIPFPFPCRGIGLMSMGLYRTILLCLSFFLDCFEWPTGWVTNRLFFGWNRRKSTRCLST